MAGRSTTILISLLAGLIGGTVPRIFITNPRVTRVIRAERIELVNERGKAVAIFDVEYSKEFPAGSPNLTFTDRNEILHQDRKAVLSPERLRLDNDQGESTMLEAGQGLTFRDATGRGSVGMTLQHGIYVEEPSGITTLSSHGLYVADNEGHD